MSDGGRARRILIVMHYIPPHLGGMEQIVHQQATSLAARGHEVTVVTCSHERGLPRAERTPHGYAVRRVAAFNAIERRFGVTFPVVSPFILLTLWRLARRSDLVHVHDVFYPTSHAASLASFLAGKPLYLTQHVALVDHPSTAVMAVQKAIYGTVGRAILRHARRVVVYNSNVRDHLAAMGVDEQKILLIHNGIDTSHFTPATAAERMALRQDLGLPADKPVVLFAGRLVPKKGFDLVVGARDPGHVTLVVGVGAIPPSMVDLDDVVFFGPAEPSQMRDLYRLSDLFAFPSIGEIFTLVMQEALACGLPVLTTADPAYAKAGLDPTVVAMCDRTQTAVSAAVRSLLADPDRRAFMAEAGRQLALDRFSWDANYDGEYAIYDFDAPEGPDPVAYVAPYYPPALGGMERVAQVVAEGMGRRRHVVVITASTGSRPGAAVEGGVAVRRLRTLKVLGIPIMPGLLPALVRLPRRTVVHVHLAQALVPDLVWLASRLRRLRYVVHFHMDVDASGRFGPLFNAWKRVALGRILRDADRVIVLSPEQIDFVSRTYEVPLERIVVVPNGVDDAFIADHPHAVDHPGPIRLLFVGRLSPQKNLPRLLQAVALTRSLVEVVIVGDGEERESLSAIIGDLGLENARLVGAARGDQLVAWYEWADVFVMASDREGMPLVLLDALAAGLPVVATDVVGIRETVGSDGLLAAPDPAALAAAIDRVAGDPALRADLAARSHRRGAGLRWEAQLDKLDAMYANLAAEVGA